MRASNCWLKLTLGESDFLQISSRLQQGSYNVLPLTPDGARKTGQKKSNERL